MVNERLEISDAGLQVIIEGMTPEQAFRTALSGLLESVLMDTGNYKGFMYLNHAEVRDPDSGPTDPTRRMYF